MGLGTRVTSYHWPISLNFGRISCSPYQFRFENVWLDHPSFNPPCLFGGILGLMENGKVFASFKSMYV